MPKRRQRSRSSQRIVRRKLKRARVAQHPDATRMHVWDEHLPGREVRWETDKWRKRTEAA